jgi:hypothetical protein
MRRSATRAPSARVRRVDIASVGIGPTGDHVAGLTDSIE